MFIFIEKESVLDAKPAQTATENNKEQSCCQAEDSAIKKLEQTVAQAQEDVLKIEEKKIEGKKEENNSHFKTQSSMANGNFAATPLIPETVYQNLPPYLKGLTANYKAGTRQRDVFTTGLFTVISGCLFPITGIYKKRKVYPNMYSFVIAGAGGGKASLNDCRSIVRPLDAHLFQSTSEGKPIRLLIPADISASMQIEIQHQNNGCGILIAAEADTVGYNQKKEWGNTSDKWRLNYHSEEINFARKATKEFLRIENPCMAICLSGTFQQLYPIIPDVENGLFSRFLFYAFEQEDYWENLTEEDGELDTSSIMESKGEELIKVYEYYKQHPKHFCFTEGQREVINARFYQNLEGMKKEYGNHGSIIKRLGLVTYRLCIQFSAFRHFELKTPEEKICIADQDFQTALELVDVYLQHAKAILEIIPEAPVPGLHDKMMSFFKILPNAFKREQIIGREAKGITERTMDRWLSKLVDAGKLKLVKKGEYAK